MKNINKLIPYALSIVLLLMLSAVSSLAADSGERELVLSWTGDPATSVTASWRGDAERQEYMQIAPELTYNEKGFNEAITVEAACKDISLDNTGTWHFEAAVSDLTPDTVYCYRVGCDGDWSEAETFKTDDPTSKSVTFAYMGDVQTANDMEGDYALWGRLCEVMYERNPELSFTILGGDLVNSGISTEMFDCLLRNASPVFSKVPLFSTAGNHESNFLGGKPELYLDYFAFPRNGPEGFAEEFYSFDCGNVHILSLNDWIFSGEQNLSDEDFECVADWIRNDLATSRADWQIAVLHVPVYEVHSDTRSTMVREAWAGIFEDYGVDLVFEGHQHVYSRSYPMYQERVDYENGITYVMGVSGSKFYDSADESRAERTVYCTANYELVRTDGDAMTLLAMDIDGNELDYASISQRGVSVTRGEYMETLWKAAGSPTPARESPFTDADTPAITWGFETGLVNGYGGGIFGTNDPIKDWQIDLILSRR